MKLRIFGPVMLAGLALSFFSGCAVFDKGRTQTVVVRSSPSGATTLINGLEAGKTPLKVDMPRSSAHTIEVRKPGFENAIVAVLPVANEYNKRFLRWGVDYELGAMTDLTPGEVQFVLTPALAAEDKGDAFSEMTQRVLQADAMLAAKQISPQDHKFIVAKITEFYSR